MNLETEFLNVLKRMAVALETIANKGSGITYTTSHYINSNAGTGKSEIYFASDLPLKEDNND
jgi:hypothetical protein